MENEHTFKGEEAAQVGGAAPVEAATQGEEAAPVEAATQGEEAAQAGGVISEIPLSEDMKVQLGIGEKLEKLLVRMMNLKTDRGFINFVLRLNAETKEEFQRLTRMVRGLQLQSLDDKWEGENMRGFLIVLGKVDQAIKDRER